MAIGSCTSNTGGSAVDDSLNESQSNGITIEQASDAEEAAPVHEPTGPDEIVPAPEGGDIETEVDAGVLELLPAVDFDDSVELPALTVELSDLQRTNVEAQMAGETSGPGLVVRVRVSNRSGESIDLTSTTVAAETSSGDPLAPMTAAPNQPFFGPLDAGDSAEAVYAFRIYTEAPDGNFVITVNPSPNIPVAVFTGAIS